MCHHCTLETKNRVSSGTGVDDFETRAGCFISQRSKCMNRKLEFVAPAVLRSRRALQESDSTATGVDVEDENYSNDKASAVDSHHAESVDEL